MGNTLCERCVNAQDKSTEEHFDINNKKKILNGEIKNQSQTHSLNPEETKVSSELLKQTHLSKSDPLYALPENLPLQSKIVRKKTNKPEMKFTESFYPPQSQQVEGRVQELPTITEYGTESALDSRVRLPQNSRASENFSSSKKVIE